MGWGVPGASWSLLCNQPRGVPSGLSRPSASRGRGTFPGCLGRGGLLWLTSLPPSLPAVPGTGQPRTALHLPPWEARSRSPGWGAASPAAECRAVRYRCHARQGANSEPVRHTGAPHQLWGRKKAGSGEGTHGGQLCDQSPRSGVSFTHKCLGVWNSFLMTTVYETKSDWPASGVTSFVLISGPGGRDGEAGHVLRALQVSRSFPTLRPKGPTGVVCRCPDSELTCAKALRFEQRGCGWRIRQDGCRWVKVWARCHGA